MLDNTTIILRECGERTADAAYHLLSQIVAPEALHRVNTAPFSRCLAESFKLGIVQGREWTLCIDADVLVTAVGIYELQATAELLPAHVFEIQGMIQDRFFGICRPAGNHLYRTSYLGQAMKFIPVEGTSLRPESSTINRMSELGFVDVQLPTITGIHDFEQNYHDIYRKCFLQGKKHDYLKDYLLPRWQAEANEGNTESVIAHAAMTAGLRFAGEVMVDRRFQEEQVGHAMAELGVDTRSALEIDNITEEWVEAQIQLARGKLDAAAMHEQAGINVNYFAKSKFNSSINKPIIQSPRSVPFNTIMKALLTLPRRFLHRLWR